MKKLKLIAVIAAITLCVGALFTGCLPSDPKGGGTVTITIGEESYPVTTEKDYIGQVLDEMAARGEITVSFSGNASDPYGRYLEALNSLSPQSGEYVALYSIVEDAQYSYVLSEITFDGVVYYPANFGADQMPVFDGAKYLFRIE